MQRTKNYRAKLEDDLGFAGGYVSKLNKSTPNTDKINQIANYFSVSLDYLVNGKELTYSDESAHLVAKIRKDPNYPKRYQNTLNCPMSKRTTL